MPNRPLDEWEKKHYTQLLKDAEDDKARAEKTIEFAREKLEKGTWTSETGHIEEIKHA